MTAESSDSFTNSVDQALSYAARGWPVLPVHPTEKKPLIKTGKNHARATTRPALIRQWWRKFPNARIGLRTGIAFDVIDLDNEAANLWENLSPVESGPMVRTRRGLHLYVAARPDHPRRNCCGMVAPGVDLRGFGSYVVAPTPGSVYQWVPGRGPEAPIPDDHPVLDNWDPPEAPGYIEERAAPATQSQSGDRPRMLHLVMPPADAAPPLARWELLVNNEPDTMSAADREMGKPSPSEHDMVLAHLLAAAEFTPQETADTLAWNRRRRSEKVKHLTYYQLTVNKAYMRRNQ